MKIAQDAVGRWAGIWPVSNWLNKTFCYLFTQICRLFEMIIRTYLA